MIPALWGDAAFSLKEKKPCVKPAKVHPWQDGEISTAPQGLLSGGFSLYLGNSSNQFLLLRAHNLGFKAADVILVYLLYNIVYA